MERMTTATNFISEYINITAFLTSDIFTSGILVTPSNFESDLMTSNSSGKVSASSFDVEVPNRTLILMSSEKTLQFTNRSEMIDITKSYASNILLTSLDLHNKSVLSFARGTTRFPLSNLMSSFDLSTNRNLFSSYIFETNVLGTSALKSNTPLSISDAISDTILAITNLPSVLSNKMSTSSAKHYSTYDTVVHTTYVVETDTTTRSYFSIFQTHQPDSTVNVSNKRLSSAETSLHLPTNSSADVTFETLLSKLPIYTTHIENDIISTKIQIYGYTSSISINLNPSIKSSSGMNTSNSLIFESNSSITESRMFGPDYLQSSFYPTEQVFSPRTTDYSMTSMQATNSFLVSSTEDNPSTVNSDIMISDPKSSVYTVQKTDMLTIQNISLIRTTIDNSVLRTSLVTSHSEIEHQRDQSMSHHLFSGTIDISYFITAQSASRNSFYSLVYSSESSNAIFSTSKTFLYAASSADFISTTIHSTSNSKAGISESTKNAMFMTIVSVVVITIISVSSIMLLSRVNFERKRDNVCLSNESQSVRNVFPYMKRSIYPRFSDSLSSYMTSPYKKNWNEV